MVSAAVIFYTVYFLYICALFIDWHYIINNEYFMYGVIILLSISIFLTCAAIFYSKTLGISKYYAVLILIGLIFVLSAVLYYQYYTATVIHNSIVDKVNRMPNTQLFYQYGRDSQEIGMKLLIINDEFPRNEPKTLQEIWESIMSDRSNTKINKIKRLIVPGLIDSIDVIYNLLWYLCISEDPFGNNLSTKEIAYVTSLNTDELLSLLGNRYTGATDRASLIFAVLSGHVIPAYSTNSSRYDDIKNYDSRIVYNLAFVQNKMIDHEHGLYSLYGPYVFLSMQEVSPIETVITNVRKENYHDLVTRLGIGPVNNIERMSEEDRILHLQGELSLYHNVFTRPSGLNHPPELGDKSRNEILHNLSYYTNTELIDAYEPREIWNSRGELIKVIHDDVLGIPRWSVKSVTYCNNDNTINIMSGDLHVDSDKYDRDDPTLSYGIHKNYRCFQSSELEGCFRDYDGIFMFKVPDWTADTIDPISNAQLIEEFPVESIKQLKTLLERESTNYNVSGLLGQINRGFEYLKSAHMQIRKFKNQLIEFTFEQKQIVELYFAWMFTYSMWMRFWKGPGFPWPLIKVNVRREADRNREQRSSPEERDEHIFIQEGVRSIIIEMYENDNVLREWINGLPTIYYDFEANTATCASHTIKSILDQIAMGEYCMGFGSDTILKTAYYYVTSLLDYGQGHVFDEFIERMLPRLQDLEYRAVTNQLLTVTTVGTRMHVLNNRLHVLHEPVRKQQSFNPGSYQNNIHVE